MSWKDVILNLATGKPGFENKDSAQSKSEPVDQPAPSLPDADSGPTIRKHDAASYPKVILDRRLKVTPESSGRVSVYGQIKNSWPEEAWIEEVTIFGKDKQRMSESLHGHEEDELRLYEGAALTKQYPEAIMRYWVLNKVTQKRDYFQVVYRITYTYDPKTNTQIPNEAQFIRIDDIFG